MNKAFLMTGGNDSGTRQPFDFYPTPEAVTRGLLGQEVFTGSILEPASGAGHISKVLEEYYPDTDIFSSDIREGCYGISGVDFLENNADFYNYPENIITNPPYKQATEFILHAKEIASHKIAMLLKLNALAGLDRYRKIWTEKIFPLKKVIILTKRPDFMLQNAPTLEYCWVIWEKYYTGDPVMVWFDNSRKEITL